MDKKVKALVWEEFRVGGVIAAWCAVLCAFYLVVCRATTGPYAMRSSDLLAVPVALGAPLLIALLLILNPNQSGHLIGGFSRRILWLPVPTFVAVAVTLAMRALFVFAASLAILGATQGLFVGGPALTLAAVFVVAYLVAQVLDWLREPLSGLSSAICVLALVVLVMYIVGHDTVADAFGRIHVATWGHAILLVAALAVPAYAASVAAVHAARVGWHTGVPEIWEWPKQIDIGRTAAPRRAFSSPLAAQFWFNLRRSWYVLPAGTLGLIALTFGLAWLYWISGSPKRDERFPWQLAPLFLFPPLVLAAAAHGVQSRVLGLRSAQGKAGFQYLQPFTSAEYAWAQVLLNAVLLAPVVIVILVAHFALSGARFLAEIVPFAYQTGAATPREIVWMLVSRGIFMCLIAWPLMAVGTRAVRRLVLAMAILPFVTINALGSIFVTGSDGPFTRTMWLLQAIVIAVCFGTFANCWRKQIISWRGAVAWAGVWLLTAWLLRAALPLGNEERPLGLVDYLLCTLSCLAYAALVPLPYAAIALDVARRRHGAACAQDPRQHARVRAHRNSTRRTLAWACAAGVAVAMVWLGWPQEPGYRQFLRDRGWSATLSELDASYAAVPADKNAATKYLAIAEQQDAVSAQFYEAAKKDYAREEPGKDIEESISDRLLVQGSAKLPDVGPIDPRVWEMTERYWAQVTSQVAPALIETAHEGPMPSRYPVDLNNGFDVSLEHLAKLRSLARELNIDTIHWSVQGDTGRALDAALATLTLQDSLANEPILVSQLVRVAILHIGINSIECVVQRAPLTDGDLAQLQRRLEQTLPPVAETRIFDVAMGGEFVMGLAAIWSQFAPFEMDYHAHVKRTHDPAAILMDLAMPPGFERVAMLNIYAGSRERAAGPTAYVTREESHYGDDAFAFAPLTTVLSGGLHNAYEAEWRVRMLLVIAQAAIAAERSRREKGRLPDSLDELVPAYIAAVPKDVYASNAPVRYLRRDDGAFVVYSVGRNGRDDGGLEQREGEDTDDFVFYVRGPE